jgi:hypothetical protein
MTGVERDRRPEMFILVGYFSSTTPNPHLRFGPVLSPALITGQLYILCEEATVTGKVSNPSSLPLADQTPEGAMARLRLFYPDEAESLAEGRFQVIK